MFFYPVPSISVHVQYKPEIKHNIFAVNRVK